MWAGIRTALVVASFVQGIVLTPHVGSEFNQPVEWEMVAFLFFGSIAALLFVVGLQAANPRSAPEWRYPSWSVNPFSMSEPLQFFHLCGFVFIATGLGTAIRCAYEKRPITDALVFLVIGAGTVAGVYVCALVFRRKMAHGT